MIAEMSTTSVLLLVMLTSQAAAEPPCPEGWFNNPLSNDCHHYISSPATFADARRVCGHLGGGLVIPRIQMDIVGVQNTIQKMVAADQQRNVWLDMVLMEGGGWTPYNSSSLLSSISNYWYEGYPEGDGDCGVLMYDPGEIKNKLCTLTSAFLCAGQISIAMNSSNTCPPLTPSGNNVTVGTFHYLSCEDGYELSSRGHKKTFCRRDGTWSRTSEELAVCEPIYQPCKQLRHGKNVIDITQELVVYSRFRNYTCPEGASFKNLPPSIDIIAIECRYDGVWTNMKTGSTITAIADCEPGYVGDGDPNSASHLADSRLQYLTLLTMAFTGQMLNKVIS